MSHPPGRRGVLAWRSPDTMASAAVGAGIVVTCLILLTVSTGGLPSGD